MAHKVKPEPGDARSCGVARAVGSQSPDSDGLASRVCGTFATSPVDPPDTFDSSPRIGTESQPTPGGQVIHLAAPDDNRPVEPDWTRHFPRIGDQKAAAAHWQAAVAEMSAAGTLSPACGNTIRRYIFALLSFDQAAREIAKTAPVIKARKTGTPAFSPWWTVVTQADAMALHLESQLGLSPRSRDKVSPAKRRGTRVVAAVRYLGRAQEPKR